MNYFPVCYCPSFSPIRPRSSSMWPQCVDMRFLALVCPRCQCSHRRCLNCRYSCSGISSSEPLDDASAFSPASAFSRTPTLVSRHDLGQRGTASLSSSRAPILSSVLHHSGLACLLGTTSSYSITASPSSPRAFVSRPGWHLGFLSTTVGLPHGTPSDTVHRSKPFLGVCLVRWYVSRSVP